MLRNFLGLIAMACPRLHAMLLRSLRAALLPSHGNSRHHGSGNGRWHGYGFLPGYRSPERIEAEQARNRRPVYWYGGPGFYRGRWNGGGFGPCWTQTPIGNVWNCGR